MELWAIAVVDDKLGRDPETGERAFLVKYRTFHQPITEEQIQLPIEIQVYQALLDWGAVVGYGLLLIGCPLVPLFGLLLDEPLMAWGLFVLCLATGAVLTKEHRSLYRKGRVVRTLASTVGLAD